MARPVIEVDDLRVENAPMAKVGGPGLTLSIATGERTLIDAQGNPVGDGRVEENLTTAEVADVFDALGEWLEERGRLPDGWRRA